MAAADYSALSLGVFVFSFLFEILALIQLRDWQTVERKSILQ
jgi:hypothetical protein